VSLTGTGSIDTAYTDDVLKYDSVNKTLVVNTLEYSTLSPAIPSPNDGLLTMETGTYLTGSSTFSADQSTPSTFTVATNATNLNTPSTLMARDASGSVVVNQLSYTSLSPAIPSPNDTSITFNTTPHSPALVPFPSIRVPARPSLLG
jgi:hypothetical protein